MRRVDKQRDEDFARAVVEKCEYATLATVDKEGNPYCIPISPVLIDNSVYFHTAMQGQKNDNISINSKVCLSCVGDTNLVPERFTTQYESAVVIGNCHIVIDEQEKTKALYAICEKYAASNLHEADIKIKKSLSVTQIYRISIESISGKCGR